MISDNGTNYAADDLEKLCKEWKIKHTFTSTYNACANGVSESKNKPVANVLRMFKDKNIPELKMMMERLLNDTYNRTIKATPREALFGRNDLNILGRIRA